MREIEDTNENCFLRCYRSTPIPLPQPHTPHTPPHPTLRNLTSFSYPNIFFSTFLLERGKFNSMVVFLFTLRFKRAKEKVGEHNWKSNNNWLLHYFQNLEKIYKSHKALYHSGEDPWLVCPECLFQPSDVWDPILGYQRCV